MKTLSTVEILGRVYSCPAAATEEIQNGDRRGVLQVEKKTQSQEHGSLDFYASELKG